MSSVAKVIAAKEKASVHTDDRSHEFAEPTTFGQKWR
jgi:hypothetical protein